MAEGRIGIVAALILAAGIGFAGQQVAQGIERFRMAERTLTVKGLAERDVTKVAGWDCVDFLWSTEEDGVLDPLALRAAGFDGFRRTEDALIAVFDRLRAAKVIPER